MSEVIQRIKEICNKAEKGQIDYDKALAMIHALSK